MLAFALASSSGVIEGPKWVAGLLERAKIEIVSWLSSAAAAGPLYTCAAHLATVIAARTKTGYISFRSV